MDEERLSLLRANIEAQREEIERIFAKIEERRHGEGAAYLESLGYQLHNLYCAFEDLFKIVADFFENRIEERVRYHSELLRRMKISIEGVRASTDLRGELQAARLPAGLSSLLQACLFLRA